MKILALPHRAPGTARAIIDLQRIAYRVEAERIGFPSLPPLLESVEDIRASGERFLGIAADSGLAGMIATEEQRGMTVISRLCVAPDRTRRGIATRLVECVLGSEQRDVMVSTAAANAPAISLYRQLGFATTRACRSREGLELVTLVYRRST